MNRLFVWLLSARKQLSRFANWYASLFKNTKWYVKTITVLTTLIALFILYLGAVDVNLFWQIGRAHV